VIRRQRVTRQLSRELIISTADALEPRDSIFAFANQRKVGLALPAVIPAQSSVAGPLTQGLRKRKDDESRPSFKLNPRKPEAQLLPDFHPRQRLEVLLVPLWLALRGDVQSRHGDGLGPGQVAERHTLD
jgi:hypothetical protein